MIRFGLLGCGRIAKRHSELLGGNHIEGASLTAVCGYIATLIIWRIVVTRKWRSRHSKPPLPPAHP